MTHPTNAPPRRRALFAASLIAAAVASPAAALTVTSGCVSSTSCTLTELYAGGSMTVNDIAFTNFSSQGTSEWAPYDVDFDEVTVTGSDLSFGGGAALDFSFDPVLDAVGEPAMVGAGLLFDFSVIDGMATLLGLQRVGGEIADGAGTITTTTKTYAPGSGGPLAEIDLEMTELDPGPDFGSAALPYLTQGTGTLSFFLEALDEDTTLTLEGFRLGIATTPVPLPASAPMAMVGVAALAALSRRGRRRRA